MKVYYEFRTHDDFTVKPVWLELVEASYAIDAFVQGLLQKLAIDPLADAHFTMRDGLLRYDNHIWIGQDEKLQQKIISTFHASSVGATQGFL
jgi:hypothetical protein